MSALKSALKFLVFFTAIAVIAVTFGCGTGVEKEKMSAFIQEYQTTLDAYADAIEKVDGAKKAEIESKLDTLKGQWMLLKDEIGTEVTPQTMEKFEAEFQNLAKKQAALSGKS